jgi:XTP/dITP diphosphohydrolase
MIRLLLATGNAHKTREFAEILGTDIEVADLAAHPSIVLPEETGKTFAENAIVKAIAASKAVQMLVIADDSGLEVDALGGAPGIFSARYSGANANDQRNIEKLLRELRQRNAPSNQRAAQFRCVVALAREGKLLGTFEGIVKGTIVDPPRGDRGFGYDPIFQPNEFEKTFGELDSETKNAISHRAKAIAKLREELSRQRF